MEREVQSVSMDNLSRCMIQCEKDGYGVRYGAWRAAQGDVLIVNDNGIPEGWKICEHCGKMFKPYNKRLQRFCEVGCQVSAANARHKKRREKEAVINDTETVGK